MVRFIKTFYSSQAQALHINQLINAGKKMDLTVPPYWEFHYEIIIEQVKGYIQEGIFDAQNIAFIPISDLKEDNVI